MRTPLQVLALGHHDLRDVGGRRVVRVAARDDPVEERAVAHGLRRRPDLVERRRERDDPVARHGAVRRTQPDDPAERRRLLDRAAGVGAERPRCEPARDRRRRAAARASGHARRVPRVPRRPECRVLRRGAHRELVGVRLAERDEPRVLAPLRDGRVVDGDEPLQDLRARCRLDPLRPDHVLERDRHALAVRLVDEREVAVQLAVARVDRGAVRVPELARRRPPALEQAHGLLGGQAQRVDHASRTSVVGGTRKKPPSRSGAFANTSSCGQRRARLVVAPDVHEVERVRGRRHVGEVELGDLRDGVQDRRQLLPELLDLLLGQVEVRELRDVQDLLSA